MKEIIHLHQIIEILVYEVHDQQLLVKLKVTQISFLLDIKIFITIQENKSM